MAFEEDITKLCVKNRRLSHEITYFVCAVLSILFFHEITVAQSLEISVSSLPLVYIKTNSFDAPVYKEIKYK